MESPAIVTLSRPYHAAESDHRWHPHRRRYWDADAGYSRLVFPMEVVFSCTCGETRWASEVQR